MTMTITEAQNKIDAKLCPDCGQPMQWDFDDKEWMCIDCMTEQWDFDAKAWVRINARRQAD